MHNLVDSEFNQSEEIWVTDFDEENVQKFHKEIFERFQLNPRKPITIYIDSFGGHAHGVLAMLDIMDSFRAKAPEGFIFITCTLGKAMSAGALLLSYGDARFASPNSTVMIHQLVGGTGWGVSHPEQEVEFQEQERLNNKVLDILVKRGKISESREGVKEFLRQNKYLSPQEALSFGLIDAVGTPSLVELVGYELHILSPEEELHESREPNSKTSKIKKKKGAVRTSDSKSKSGK